MLRLKIALLSALLSGLVLVGMSFYSLSVMNRAGLERIDREILALGEGHLAVGPPRGYWENFENSLRLIYGDKYSERLIVRIQGPDDQVLFQSTPWPPAITTDRFPDFDRTMEPSERGRQAGRRDKGPNRERPDRGQSPPKEAYLACEGKSAGAAARFVDERGETLEGVCEDENGRLVLRPRKQPRPAPDIPSSQAPRSDRDRRDRPRKRTKNSYFATIKTSTGEWRTGIMGSERITMLVGVNMAAYYEDAAAYRRAMTYTVPIMLILLAAGGWIIAQRALRPVAMITRTAEGISAKALDQRVPLVDADRELARLTEVINGMLDRLEKSFGQAVRFSANAAHELQTPLAIVQGELDDAVQHAPIGSEQQRRYSGLLEEIRRLKAIVQKLLILARADAGLLVLDLKAIDLSALTEDATEDAGAMAPSLRIEKDIQPGITVKADADLLGQVIRNLTTNAVKYNREGGFIRFRLGVHDDKAVFTIVNTGSPIPVSEQERIFDRFYRLDLSRSKGVSGSGLGLGVAREIAIAHHGDLRLDPGPASEISFTLSLTRLVV